MELNIIIVKTVAFRIQGMKFLPQKKKPQSMAISLYLVLINKTLV